MAVHRNAVVPDRGGNIDIVIQMLVLFVFVQFEFVGLDDSTHFATSLYIFLIFDVLLNYRQRCATNR